MKNNFLVLAFISLIIILSVSFASASSYNLKFNQIDNNLLVKHDIILDNEQTISLTLPSDATSISSTPEATIADNVLTIIGKEIQVSYITKQDLEQAEKGYYFVAKIPFAFDADKATIKLVLSEGYFIDSNNIFPKQSSIETDGKQIIVTWIVNNIKEGADFPIFLTIESSSQAITNWLVWILLIIILAFAVYFVYDKYFKKEKPKAKEEIDKYLIDSEKLILKELKQADRGEIWQKQLQLKTQFSKAKLSRVIRNLEARNLIEKIPFGNTNKIRLK